MSGTLSGLLSIVALVLAALSFWKYTGSNDNKMWLIIAVVLLLAFLAMGGMFLSGRVNRNEDIHITE
jgi:heme A synthase